MGVIKASLVTVSLMMAAGCAGVARGDDTAVAKPASTATAGATASGTTVTRGTFVKTVRLNGLVEAVQFSSIRVPQLAGAGGQQLVITRLAPKGLQVLSLIHI